MFNPGGTTLAFSTYYGGTGNDVVNGIAIDSSNKIYFGGTTSSNLVLPAGSTTSFKGVTDGFVATFNANHTIGYVTYLGGTGADTVNALAQRNGEVYVTGGTTSIDMATLNSFVSGAVSGGVNAGGQDAFITKLTTTGALSYSSYFGGSSGGTGALEQGNGIAVNSAGEAYITGVTSSANLPTTVNAVQAGFKFGVTDSFLAKFTAAGGLSWSTYFGGASGDQGNAVTVLPSGYVAMVGSTFSVDFPTLDGLQTSIASVATSDSFAAVFSPAGALYWSSYYGGSGADNAYAVTSDPGGALYFGGSSASIDLSLKSPVQTLVNNLFPHGFFTRVVPSARQGTFRPKSGQFFLLAKSDWKPYTGILRWTTMDWTNVSGLDAIPVYGDWDNTGRVRIGIYRSGTWYLDIDGDDLYTPGVDKMVTNFGMAGAYPVVGDWDHTGVTRLGYFMNGLWFLDMNNDNVFTYANDQVVPFGVANDIPVVGDWTNTGVQRLGVFRGGLWYLDVRGDHTDQGITAIAGAATDNPVFADWDASGKKHIGNYRTFGYPQGWWFCDIDGNFAYTGSPKDNYYIFGGTGDIAVAGITSH
jgi:hypothetical protein